MLYCLALTTTWAWTVRHQGMAPVVQQNIFDSAARRDVHFKQLRPRDEQLQIPKTLKPETLNPKP